MTGDSLSFDTTPAFETIASILNQPPRPASSPVVTLKQSRHVMTLHSSNFHDLSQFKDAYQTLTRPTLCFVDQSQLAEVLPWIRDSDDVAVMGEPPELTQWRFDRISRSFARQLDPLTQVYQREFLIDTLEELCPRASVATPVSLILLDIDNLKSINDDLGPVEGSKILKQLADLVQALCKMTLVARTRGGEFAILVENRESAAGEIAHVIHQSISSQPWCEHDHVTASMGVAETIVSGPPSRLLTQADAALYSAKANGRNRVVCYQQIAEISNRVGEDMDVISLENKARVMSERVTSFVTQQSKMILQNLRREADTDALTQLFNRRYLDRQLGEEFANSVNSNRPLSVALIDVDHFGEVNKKYGWPTGDAVLKEIAEVILNNVRASDWVGRYGGEELCIVMPGTKHRHGLFVCERIREAIASHRFCSVDGRPISVTLSIGLVERTPQLRTVADLMEKVSQKTLDAKQAGRNRVCG